MIYIQKWSENSFEGKYLKDISNVIKEKPNLKLYIGFDYGFFYGINIYYGSIKDKVYAQSLYDILKNRKFKIRLFTNIDYDFDIILLLGYTNNQNQRQYLWKNKKKLMKALSIF